MSRDCKAKVFGRVAVELVCDQCEKRVWFATEIKGKDPECLEQEAMSQAGWLREDDCYVCSDECSQRFWDWDAYDKVDEDTCEGGFCSAPDGDPASVDVCSKHSAEVYGR